MALTGGTTTATAGDLQTILVALRDLLSPADRRRLGRLLVQEGDR